MDSEKSIKPIFSRNDNIDKMAFLNWRMSSESVTNLFDLAEGYFDSSIILTKKCLVNNEDKKADIIIFPILTCLNHGIELYLKGFTLILNDILDNNIKIDGTHNLKQLFNTLKSRIKDLDGQKGLNEFEKEFKDLSEYIEELNAKIEASPKNDKMDFSRYPFSKKDGNHFYVDKWTNIVVDLENLVKRIKRIYKKLDSFSNYLYYDKYEEKE
jgi:hypothetical protein